MQNSLSKRIVIAGAGCAGLAAALKLVQLGHKVTILEKLDRVGGLAGGIELGGNVYEYGPHIFHTTDPEVLTDVKDIAKDVLIPFQKTIKIKFLGRYFEFPLTMKDLLSKLQPHVVLMAGISLVYHFILGALPFRKVEPNCETTLKRYYGDVLYRLFFKDYITKVWGIEPKDLAASFAQQRIPRFDFLKFWEKIKILILGKKKESIKIDGYVEKTEGENFTTTKGFSLIAEAYAKKIVELGGSIELSANLSKVEWKSGKCEVISYEKQGRTHTISCDEFISTIPISNLPKLLSPPIESSAASSAEKLGFRGIVFVGFLVNKPQVLPASFMYFREVSFNRVTDLSWFKVEMHPPNATIVIAEITCQPKDEFWQREDLAIQTVQRELEAEGLFSGKDVLEAHVFKVEHGYPIYRLGYENHLKKALAGLEEITNLHTIGRQGKFAYINTHVAIKMGYELAKKIQNKN
jgi:protoporphyrinogen oxidase